MEIERKFLIDRFPEDYPLLKEAVVYQGYLSVKPVVRIRSMQEENGHVSYILCFKGEGTLARKEIELELKKETFEELQELLPAPMIRKDYKVYRLPDGHKLECSLVDRGSQTEFMFAEVEFDSIEEAKRFTPCDCLGREVTEERGYSMGAYWSATRQSKQQ